MSGLVSKRPAPVRVDPDGVPVMEVEAIIRSRRRRGILELLVKWRGYDDLENSWQRLEDVLNAKKLLMEFYRRQPGSSKPNKDEISLYGLEGM